MSRTYNEVKKEVSQITDRLGTPIDKGIEKLVIALRMWDFPTDASCEGHQDLGAPYPWVQIYAPEQPEKAWIQANQHERHKLSRLLNEFYKTEPDFQKFAYEDIGIFGAFRLVPNVPRKTKITEAKLLEYRQNFHLFADFILDKLH